MSELVLEFQPDNPCNSVITSQSTGEHLYTVRTDVGDKDSVTTVLDSNGKELAHWVWREHRSDLLTFTSVYGASAKPLSASAWLSSSIIPFNDSVTFKDLQKRTWKWKGNSAGSNLQLFSGTDKANPVAGFKKHHKYKDSKSGEQVDDPATLTITAAGSEILDMVLVSFLLLEKERRIREKSAVSMASSLAIPHAVDVGLPKA